MTGTLSDLEARRLTFVAFAAPHAVGAGTTADRWRTPRGYRGSGTSARRSSSLGIVPRPGRPQRRPHARRRLAAFARLVSAYEGRVTGQDTYVRYSSKDKAGAVEHDPAAVLVA